MGASLEKLLRDWLPGQRWYAGKGREIRRLTIEQDTTLASGNPGMRHLVVAVAYTDHETDRYQLLLGLRSPLPARLEHALIGWCSHDRGQRMAAYDAVHDSELTPVLLDNIIHGATVGPIAFRSLPGIELTTPSSSLVLGVEQSNTSFVFDEESICKLFRRLHTSSIIL